MVKSSKYCGGPFLNYFQSLQATFSWVFVLFLCVCASVSNPRNDFQCFLKVFYIEADFQLRPCFSRDGLLFCLHGLEMGPVSVRVAAH